MSKPKIQNPFAGRPDTTEHVDKDGNTYYTVIASAISPFFARIADYIILTLTGAAIIASFGSAAVLSEAPPPLRIIMLFVPGVIYVASKHFIYRLLEKKVRIVFSANRVSIRWWLFTKHYDRNMPFKFTIIAHPKRPVESRRLELRKAKRDLKKTYLPVKPYYEDSYYLVFEYMGQNIILLSVYLHEVASHIAARLTSVAEVMDGMNGHGSGQAQTPSDEWASAAGSLANGTNRSVS